MNRQVIHSARANAVHNFGLDPSRLVIGMIMYLLV